MIFMFTSIPLDPQAPREQHRAAQLLYMQLICITAEKNNFLKWAAGGLVQHFPWSEILFYWMVKTLPSALGSGTIYFRAIFYTIIFKNIVQNKGHGSFSQDVQKPKRPMENGLSKMFFFVNLLMWQSMSFLTVNHLCIYPAWTWYLFTH